MASREDGGEQTQTKQDDFQVGLDGIYMYSLCARQNMGHSQIQDLKLALTSVHRTICCPSQGCKSTLCKPMRFAFHVQSQGDWCGPWSRWGQFAWCGAFGFFEVGSTIFETLLRVCKPRMNCYQNMYYTYIYIYTVVNVSHNPLKPFDSSHWIEPPYRPASV